MNLSLKNEPSENFIVRRYIPPGRLEVLKAIDWLFDPNSSCLTSITSLPVPSRIESHSIWFEPILILMFVLVGFGYIDNFLRSFSCTDTLPSMMLILSIQILLPFPLSNQNLYLKPSTNVDWASSITSRLQSSLPFGEKSKLSFAVFRSVEFVHCFLKVPWRPHQSIPLGGGGGG